MQQPPKISAPPRALRVDFHSSRGNQLTSKARIFTRRFAFYALLVLVAFVALFPIVSVLLGSVQKAQELYSGSSFFPTTFEWNNYVTAWNDGNFKTFLPNSLFYTVIAVIGILIVASMAGYALARIEFPGSKVVMFLILAIMIIPAPASFIAVYKVLVNMHLANTRQGYILVLIAEGLPLSIMIMRSFFVRQPKELEEAAVLDGSSSFGVFWRIMLPLARPGLAAVAVIEALHVWNEYLLALVIFNDDSLMPVQRGLTRFVSAETPQTNILLAATAISVLPIIVLYLFAQRNITQGIAEGAVK